MTRNLRFVALAALGASAACGGTESNTATEPLLEDATFSAALSEDGDHASDVIADPSDEEAAADDVTDDLDDPPLMPEDCSLAAVRARVIDTYDTNGDGELSNSERATLRDDFDAVPRNHGRRAARRHMLRRLFFAYAADSSQTLNDEERDALRADLETRCSNRQAWVATHGGLEAVRAAMTQKAQERLACVIAQFDTNASQSIDTEEEKAALHEAIVANIRQRREDFMASFDQDGQAGLSDSEQAHYIDEVKSIVRGEHFGEEHRDFCDAEDG